jgi:hypothetical protein
MRRIVLTLALLLTAPAALADDYDDGVSAVQSKQYGLAIGAFRKAITQAPVETPTYLPHYWIGVAKFHNGDLNGALQHWALSEAQGAIKKTPQYAQMKDYIARAQSEKQKRASAEPDAPKKAAESAMSRAIAKQSEAIGARRDRSESYRNGQRRLQEANAEFRKGSYGAAARLANEATDLFSGGAPAVLFDQESPAKPAEKPQVISAAEADALVAADKQRRRVREPEKKPREIVVEPQPIEPPAPAPPQPKKPDLEPAYRAYAMGDLGASEAQLTRIISATPTAEAFLLRGCARYTKALLTRGTTEAAEADFREALKRDDELRLDETAFSPKLVSFFEAIRARR